LLTEHESELQSAARRFLQTECTPRRVRAAEQGQRSVDRELWQWMTELGWPGVSITPEFGGLGDQLATAGLLLGEVGRHLAPVPLRNAVSAAAVIADFGARELRERSLPQLVGGMTIALALQESRRPLYDPPEATLTARGDGGYLLSGEKNFVDAFPDAGQVLLSAKWPDGAPVLALLPSDSPGISYTSLLPIGRDSQATVRFDHVLVDPEAVLSPTADNRCPVRYLTDVAVIMLCAQILGATRRDLELAVDYSKQRVAFNHPIGSFQSIRHACADALIWLDGADLLVSDALWSLSTGEPASIKASMAKAFVNERCLRICRLSQQIHGGIGFMEEFDLQLWYRRVASWVLRLGTTREHRARVARALMAHRGPIRTDENLEEWPA
jgi:alkylation response protein AidB-like acyl-CoA dehydrogenase